MFITITSALALHQAARWIITSWEFLRDLVPIVTVVVEKQLRGLCLTDRRAVICFGHIYEDDQMEQFILITAINRLKINKKQCPNSRLDWGNR